MLYALVGAGHGGCRCLRYLSLFYQFNHSILHHLAKHLHRRQALTLSDGFHHSIARGAHTALYREHGGRNVSGLHVAEEEVDHVLSDACEVGIGVDKATRLFLDIAINNAHNLLGVNLYIVGAYALSHRKQGYGLAVRILSTLVHVVQQLAVRTMKAVQLDDDALGHTHNGGHDAPRGGKIGAAHGVELVKVAHLDDGPVNLAIEATAQAFGHMSQVHIFIVDLAQVGMCAEVFIGREGSTKLYGMHIGEVAL